MDNVSAGKDILSFCTRCKSTLSHIVVVMGDNNTPDRVQCNTCKSMHKFKTKDLGAKSKEQMATKEKKARASKKIKKDIFNRNLSHEELWQKETTKSGVTTISYTPKTIFNKGDLLNHPKYGMGFVEKIKDKNKIEVHFQSDTKTLMHNL